MVSGTPNLLEWWGTGMVYLAWHICLERGAAAGHHCPLTTAKLNEARDDGVLGRQWHQPDHMQTICTSLQTDNHTDTSSLIFYTPDALPAAQTNSVKALEALHNIL